MDPQVLLLVLSPCVSTPEFSGVSCAGDDWALDSLIGWGPLHPFLQPKVPCGVCVSGFRVLLGFRGHHDPVLCYRGGSSNTAFTGDVVSLSYAVWVGP